MGPAQRPLHLLFFDESSADHLIDLRLHECRANGFPLPSTLAEVRDELAVIADVCSKVIASVDDLLRSARTRLNGSQLREQLAHPLEAFSSDHFVPALVFVCQNGAAVDADSERHSG